MNSINNSSYVAPVAKTVVLGSNSLLCVSNEQVSSRGISLGSGYRVFEGRDNEGTNSDF